MQWTAPIQRHRNVAYWLQAAVAASRIDFRSTLNKRHTSGDVRFPLIHFCFFAASDIPGALADFRVLVLP